MDEDREPKKFQVTTATTERGVFISIKDILNVLEVITDIPTIKENLRRIQRENGEVF